MRVVARVRIYCALQSARKYSNILPPRIRGIAEGGFIASCSTLYIDRLLQLISATRLSLIMATITSPGTVRPTRWLRVETFANDPLHSAAHLTGLNSYLTADIPERSPISNTSLAQGPSVYRFDLSQSSRPIPTAYSDVNDLRDSLVSTGPRSELVFIAGHPSKEWLRALLDCSTIDYRFLHSHLDFLLGAHRDWFVRSSVPSRNQHYIRLLIPSIVFFGMESRRDSAKELHSARRSCDTQLTEKARNLFGGSTVSRGHSIIRNINIHSGDMMVIEQAVSISVTRTDDGFKGEDFQGYVFQNQTDTM